MLRSCWYPLSAGDQRHLARGPGHPVGNAFTLQSTKTAAAFTSQRCPALHS